MSTKINYEVLKSLTLPTPEKEPEDNIFSRIRLGSVSEGPKPAATKSRKTEKKHAEKPSEAVEDTPAETENDQDMGEQLSTNVQLKLVFLNHANCYFDFFR